MRPKTSPRATARRRGTAVVEFAVIAPVLVFLTVGIVEMTRGFQVREILSDAARRGCRSGIQPGSSNSAVTTDINDVLTKNSITSTDATITITVNGNTADVSTAVQNDKVLVQISIPASKVAWITPVFLSSSRNIVESIT